MRNKRFVAISALAILLALLVNLPSNDSFAAVESVLGISFIFFFPGYSLVKLMFNHELSSMEYLIFSIGLSVSLAIIASMAVYFSGMSIGFAAIMDVLLAVTIATSVANVFKKPAAKIIKEEEYGRERA